jgi:hypothetical protein
MQIARTMQITGWTIPRACHTQVLSRPQVKGTVALKAACIRPASSALNVRR